MSKFYCEWPKKAYKPHALEKWAYDESRKKFLSDIKKREDRLRKVIKENPNIKALIRNAEAEIIEKEQADREFFLKDKEGK